jgi:hypothetical protein
MDKNADHIQNKLILLKHHFVDLNEGIQKLQGDKIAVNAAIEDIKTLIDELTKTLPKPYQKEVIQSDKKSFKDFINDK